MNERTNIAPQWINGTAWYSETKNDFFFYLFKWITVQRLTQYPSLRIVKIMKYEFFFFIAIDFICNFFFLSHSIKSTYMSVYMRTILDVRLINCEVPKTSSASALNPMPQIPMCMQFCQESHAHARLNETKSKLLNEKFTIAYRNMLAERKKEGKK